MEDRVKLYVLGISYSRLQSGAFALLLAEENGPYRIPVIVGAAEAQAIAMKIEGVLPARPLTHDLFVSFSHAFGIMLKEVFIYKFENGIFSSELTFTDGSREVVIDSRTSDAIAIAMRVKAPIYTTRALLNATGFIIENENEAVASQNDIEDDNAGTEFTEEFPTGTSGDEKSLEYLSDEELQKIIERFSQEEDYEEAARASEILDRRKISQPSQPSSDETLDLLSSILNEAIDDTGSNGNDNEKGDEPEDGDKNDEIK